MNTSTYLIKAIENYSFDLEQCYESLNYALSYEEDNPIALCLMGRLQDEYFGNPTLAIEYFDRALGSDLSYVETYYYYIDLLIRIEKLDKAARLIDYASTHVPYQKVKWLVYDALVLERRLKFKKAQKKLNDAKHVCYESSDMNWIESILSRIEKKNQ